MATMTASAGPAKGGQAPALKESAAAPGAGGGSRALAEPQPPNAATSREQFISGVEAAEAVLDAVPGSDATCVSACLRARHGL